MNIYDRIACETNSYAELVQREKGDRWSNTSLPESCAFTWLNILMGDSLHYSYEEYWRDNDLLGSPVFKNIMTYSRYEKLSQYIHLNAAAARERPDNANYNPVTKVKPFYDVTNQNFWRYYQHSTEISIDKAMKRVHRKTWASPEKFGINFWARCDCRTSYMYMFQLYTGNVTGPPPPPIQLQYGLEYRVVHDLTRELVGQNHHVYHDRFFTGWFWLQIFYWEIFTTLCYTKSKPVGARDPSSTTTKEIRHQTTDSDSPAWRLSSVQEGRLISYSLERSQCCTYTTTALAILWDASVK